MADFAANAMTWGLSIPSTTLRNHTIVEIYQAWLESRIGFTDAVNRLIEHEFTEDAAIKAVNQWVSNEGAPVLPGVAYSPLVGQIYRHYKGHHYQVICAQFINERDGHHSILYRPLDASRDGPFGRPLEEWQQSVYHEGKFVRRFELCT